MIVTRRRGAPSRRAIVVAATGSVGETIAPSAKAAAQGRSIRRLAATATAQVVSATRPIESIEIARASAFSSRRLAKKAAT